MRRTAYSQAIRRLRLLAVTTLTCAALAAAAQVRAPVTIFLAGDSTMAPKLPERRPETGWGEALQQHFDSLRVRVDNHALNGRSTRTFIAEQRWQAIIDRLHAGDYVFIQFGHNDASPDKPDRFTPPDQYRANLIRFVNDVRARRAEPVLLTPVMRRRFNAQGELYDTHGEYPDIVREVARVQAVTLLDMHVASARLLRTLGAEPSKALFLHLRPGGHANYPDGLEDNTHFSPHGAAQLAQLAIDALREQRHPLAAALRAREVSR